MIDLPDLERVFAAALGTGGDFCDVFIERKLATGVSCEANRIERVQTGIDQGAGVRVLFNDNTAYAYTNDVSVEGLLRVAGVASKAVRGSKKDVDVRLMPREPAYSFEIVKSPDMVPVDSKVDLVLRANQAAWAFDGRVRQVLVAYADAIQEVTVANSAGDYIEGKRIRTRMVANVVISDGKVMQTGFESLGAFSGFEFFEGNRSPEDLAKAAAQRAVLMLEAKPAPAGKMAVVMAGEAGGTMVHEACGHGLEADLVQKQLSVYAGKRGEKVASELVTVVDDATVPNRYGSFPFDDEGTPGQKTVLIENGVLKNHMWDRLTAARDKTRSTGNGRRESYQHKPIPRMSNTFIASGKSDPGEIIASTKKGLFVKKMGGGQVNTITGDFVFDVSEGYLIENGKVTVPVRGATLTGNGPEVLRIIDMVGSDLGWGIGTCGKDGQAVPVADAQPTIRIPELVVGGILD